MVSGIHWNIWPRFPAAKEIYCMPGWCIVGRRLRSKYSARPLKCPPFVLYSTAFIHTITLPGISNSETHNHCLQKPAHPSQSLQWRQSYLVMAEGLTATTTLYTIFIFCLHAHSCFQRLQRPPDDFSLLWMSSRTPWTAGSAGPSPSLSQRLLSQGCIAFSCVMLTGFLIVNFRKN